MTVEIWLEFHWLADRLEVFAVDAEGNVEWLATAEPEPRTM